VNNVQPTHALGVVEFVSRCPLSPVDPKGSLRLSD